MRDALLEQPIHAMPPLRFKGAGIYAIYYTGDFRVYSRITEQNRNGRFAYPIYVRKAVPKGSRKGGIIKDPSASTAIAGRLRHHSESIGAATNLSVTDFFFRYLVVDDIWILLGDTYLIERFQPVWNKIVEGFGIHTPGKGRRGQYTSAWDTLHPGRRFVAGLGLPPHPKSAADLSREVEEYLAMPFEEQAKVPTKEFGDEDGSDE